MSNNTGGVERGNFFVGKVGTVLACGTISLGAYWGWIFVLYSSVVVNPFGNDSISSYCMLNVLAAGCSAACMLLISWFPKKASRAFQGVRGTVFLSVAACAGCIPALLFQLGIPLLFWETALLWSLAACASSVILLNTGRFFVWLKRKRLSRCISISFLAAAVFYALPQLIYPLPAVVCVMTLPVIACVCTQLTGKITARDSCLTLRQSDSSINCQQSYLSRLAEMKTFAPLTLLYTISFGIVSYLVLSIAVMNGFVFVIVAAICVSSLFLIVCTFAFDTKIENERFRRSLLVLVAVALLPYPYLSMPMKVVFLSLAVFGFTCFDAIGWGDLADEVRDRNLDFFTYTSIPTFINFAGIFIGWGLGGLLYSVFGTSGFDHIFGILTAVLVILLILYLTFGNFAGDREQASIQEPVEHQDLWKERCERLGAEYGLTAQEIRVFSLLARGYSYNHIAEDLVISGHTVKTHVYHIYRKLEVHTQQDLISLVENKT